jgi:hypothetical protein
MVVGLAMRLGGALVRDATLQQLWTETRIVVACAIAVNISCRCRGCVNSSGADAAAQ